MKVYVHYESQEFSSTKIRELSGGDTAHAVVEWFVGSHLPQEADKFPKMDSLCLSSLDGDKFISNTILTGCIANKSDLFITVTKAGKGYGSLRKSTPPTQSVQPHTKASSSTSSAKSKPGPISDPTKAAEKAVELYQQKKYRSAMELCWAVLDSGSQANVYTSLMLNLMCEMNIVQNKFDTAISCARKNKKLNPSDPEANLLMAKALIAADNHEEALEVLEEFAAVEDRVSKKPDGSALILLAAAYQTDCLLATGQYMQAADVVNNYLGLPGADSHSALLTSYADLALRHGKIEEGMRALLKAIIVDQSSDRVRKLFASTISTPGGMAELLGQVPANKGSATAIVFLAQVAKDFSALSASATLYRLVLDPSISSDNANFALNLVHVLEAANTPWDALSAAKDFFKVNPNMKIGKNGCLCKELLEALIKSEVRSKKSAFEPPSHFARYIDDGERGLVVVEAVPCEGSASATSTATTATERGTEQLSDNSLDLLALGFTIIKLLYSVGELSSICSFFALLEPSRQRSKTLIHETSIRNEHAYYQCIAMTLSVRSTMSFTSPDLDSVEIFKRSVSDPCKSPDLAAAAANPIYICGDSHSIVPAWSVLQASGGPRLLIPKLVTGCKHWHLRPESSFYPKANFVNVLKSIPKDAEVIFLLGEIDCRDGIIVAVERGKYKDVEEGIVHTVGIFMNVIESLIKQKQFKIYIHPIPPVLDPTRPIVVKYNEIYKREVDKLKARGLSVKWLDFFNEFIDSGKSGLRDEYKLDGTHLHPKYLELIEKEF